MSPYDKGASSRAKADRPNYGSKQGSKSPKHRGYRPDADAGPAKKQRWDAAERSARTGGRPDSTGGRPNWEPRKTAGSNPRFGGAREDRDARNGARGAEQRPGRSYDRDDRSSRPSGDRSYGDRPQRDDRGPRTWDRSDRPARDDRAPRSYDRSDRAPRSYDRSDRPARDERAPRSYDRSDRPARDDRAPRSYDRSDRPARDDRAPRSYDRSDRPARDDRAPRSFDRSDRPARDDRAPRSFDRSDRPARDDRAPRSFDRSDRPARSFDRSDRPARSFDRDDRAPRRDRDERGSDFYPKRDRAEGQHFSPEDDVKLEKLKAEVVTAAEVVGMSFEDLGLGSNIIRQLAELGAPSPFPIQAATIPDVLAGKDVLGRGRTGSGKTIAFGAPLVEKLMENGGGKNRKMGRKPRALILAPTRELAMQIDRTVQPIARSVGLFTTQIYGGVPQQRQVGALNRGVDIVIGTPGRIEDLIDQGRLDLSEVVITVLDEADHMCDLGFLEPVQRIIRETADVTPTGARAQKLLFSATLDKGVAKLVDEFLVDPAVHEVAGEDQASSTIDHRVLLIEQRDKGAVIEQLAQGGGKTLVFARTRAFAEQLADQLEDAGIATTSLHGDLNQARRTRNLQLLTSGRVNVLVATDVAARGIHVDDIELVIQADAPDEYKTYMHRSGRTGRAGKEGTVVTLITRARRRRMSELLERAEIEAEMIDARPGDALIDQLAGANR
ncbi:ATP-dependent RNA helicase RhlE [Frondihabitans sp. 762G35]|uniref:DEAD/DEAH box helicase n=1 Tax=Frondihabitans sp. 762G35 TaxID=1446794 RepID=UPI000D201A92|nr:DEAD/DEAH box helicase [Frondihabitans sp. 762G35]ARC58124.1 ATP-dependent RNA helicase RhlE [Frondihabitans sp. 762G35]